jgi:hypothetical protein
MVAVAQGLMKQVSFKKQTGLGVAGSGAGGQVLRRTSSAFTLTRDSYEANEIVAHQQSTGSTAGIGKTTGKLDALVSPGTYSALFASLLRKDFVATSPMPTLSLTIGALAAGVYPLTRTTGNWLTDGLKVGDIIRLTVGSLNPANIAKNLVVTAINSGTPTICSVAPVNGVALVPEGPVTGCTVTVIGKKSWVPTTGHTSDYHTFEEWYADLSKSELFTDVKVGKADITIPATGNASVSFDLPGLGRTLGTSRVLTSPTAETTTNVLTAVNGVVLVAGAATAITGATVAIDGHIQPGEAEVGTNSVSDLIRGEVSVTGQFTAKFSATTLQTLYVNQTPATLILIVTDGSGGAAEFVAMTMSNIKLFSDSADDGEAKEVIRTYSFVAAIDGAGGTGAATNQTIVSVQDSLAA